MKGAQRWVIVGDNHGDRRDGPTVKAFHEFVKHWKPQLRIHAGDCFDFRFLRSGASDEEKRAPVQRDIDEGNAFLRQFKPTHFLRGNHDERCWRAAKSDDKPLAEYAAGIIEDMDIPENCRMYPYDKRRGVMQLGDSRVIHGYGSGVTAVRQAAMIYGNVFMAHIHAVDVASAPGIERRIGRSIGCVCKLSQDYNAAHLQTLRQSHGWAYGILRYSKLVVWQAERVGGKFYLPSEVREVAA